MNESTPPLAQPLPYDPETGEILPPDEGFGGLPAPRGAQQTALGNQAIKVLVSTPIVERRNPAVVRTRLRALCAENGDKYVYSWTVKDRNNNRETVIEGLTIKAAMDLWRTYGNCFAGPLDCEDRGSHWLFTAIFFDRETGSIAMRQFLQRKAQDTGMRDKDRAQDIVFQIGQSKAIRNVIVNALSADANFMLELSKKGLVEWVKNHPDKVNDFIDRVCEDNTIDQRRIEAVIGRVRKDWTVRDIARVATELRGIDEGLQNEQDAFPSLEAAGDLMAEKQAVSKEEKKPAKKAATPEKTAKKEPGPSKGEEKPAAEEAPKAKRRGRPKGSKNKPKDEETPATAPERATQAEEAAEAPEAQEAEETPPAASEAQETASEDEAPEQGELGGDEWDGFE